MHHWCLRCPLGCVLRCKTEGDGLKLRIPVQVTLEVLEQDDLLSEGSGIGKECMGVHLLPVTGQRELLLGLCIYHQGWNTLDVVEMKEIGIKDDFGRIVE